MIEVRDIPDFNDYLESLLVQNECDDLEFKSAAGGFPGNFWDTYSAFVNSEGGTIVLGVQKEKGKFFLDNLTEELQAPDKVVLTMPMESFLSEESKRKLTEKFGIIANSFDHNILTTLALACDEGYVTNTRLRYSLNLHKSAISDMLKLMTQKGLLISEGYGRGTRYVLPVKGIDVLREEPSNVESSKSANVATSESNVESSDPNIESSKDANVETSDANMASPVKKKMSWEELQELILKNCQEWISLEDLAKSIHRTPLYLRNHVMPLLLAANKIQMLYPKNHPKQLYKVID